MEPTFQERSTEVTRKRELPIQTSLKRRKEGHNNDYLLQIQRL